MKASNQNSRRRLWKPCNRKPRRVRKPLTIRLGLQEYDENGNLIGSEGQDTESADNGVIWIVTVPLEL